MRNETKSEALVMIVAGVITMGIAIHLGIKMVESNDPLAFKVGAMITILMPLIFAAMHHAKEISGVVKQAAVPFFSTTTRSSRI